MSWKDAEAMRMRLASVGIHLDEPAKPKPTRSAAPAQAPEVDRRKIRRILAAKVPPIHLDWMTESCPSVKHARSYRHPEPRKPPIPPAAEDSTSSGEPGNTPEPPVTADYAFDPQELTDEP